MVDSFEKNKHEVICVGVNEWMNEIQFYIRTFMPSEDGEGILPTKKGISLPIEKFRELLSGLRLLGEGLREDKIFARIRKSPNQEVRVGFQHFRDIPMVYIRIFSKYGEDNTFKPTKRGVSLRVEKYPELLNAVEKLGEEIQLFFKGESKQNNYIPTPAQAKKENTIPKIKKSSPPTVKHTKSQQSKSKRQKSRNNSVGSFFE